MKRLYKFCVNNPDEEIINASHEDITEAISAAKNNPINPARIR